jgi:hypothetical protein
VGSSEEYIVSDYPMSEERPLDASNPYGISKVTQEQFARMYRDRFGMKVYCVRPFNHTGIGQRDSFVLPSWCRQVAEIERSGEYSGLMTIEEERSCNCCMHTPHGRLDITVTGEKVGFGSRSGGKHAELVYTTSFAGGSSHISIRFNIKPQA